MNRERVRQNDYNLLNVGFTQTQIERLTQFRSKYLEKEQEEMMREYRRLDFMRWLVATGRLTD